MKYEELLNFLQNIGKDPSRLIFEDELTGIYNRRFLYQYFQYKVDWDALQDHPLSLILLDMDRFKEINDTYGHQVGDQALNWVAGLLKEVSGNEGLPIRYAGDEFMILLPRRGKEEAVQVGERLLQRAHEDSFSLGKEGDGRIRITLSIGIASAPEDAQTGRGLIQKADTALYYAKKRGRDRLASAGSIPLEEVFAKTALYQLQEDTIAGRKEQLTQVSQCLQSFSQGQSYFLFVEGGSGMGKSTFLEAIRRNLAQNKSLWQTKVSGNLQEMFRPYYLVTRFLVDLLNKKEDKGVGVLETLSPRETFYLSHVLPHLGAAEEDHPQEEETATREGVFNTLVHFIPKVVESQPLVLLIDDLQFADEASLLLLRHVMLRGQFPLFICGTVAEPMPIILEGHRVPLDGFYQAHHQELNIIRIKLRPLTAPDITDHLQRIFPQIKTPENFEKDLEQITHGNPLFLGEILCKLVLEQKIILTGQQWTIEPLTKDDLPKSLESIIRQKIQNLDEENRRLLYQASTIGEDVPLSVLAGSSQIMESKILEFVDQAVNQGLLKLDFQVNDQSLRFRGKRILEIMEEDLQPEQKKKLHEQIGTYQETLFQKFLVPSAAPLIYHFKRSENLEKADTYEQHERGRSLRIFNPVEAFRYSGERRKELPPPGVPLDPESLAQIPGFIRCLLTALRNIQLYPPGSDSVMSANHQVKDALDAILKKNENLTLFQVRQALMINGQKVDVSEIKFVAEELLKLFDRLEIQGIIFHRGLTMREVTVWLEAFGRAKPKTIDRDYWYQLSKEQQLVHIELKQIRYTLRVESDGRVTYRAISHPLAGLASGKGGLSYLSGLQKLEEEELAQIPEILRLLLNAAKSSKLYPISSKNIAASIDQLQEGLRGILNKRPALTLAQVSNSLLVNGVKISTSGIEPLVEGFLKFLDANMLTSLTFLQNLTPLELKTFIAVLAQPSPSGADTEYWQRFSQEKGLTHILFDQVFYEPRMTPTLALDDQGDVVEVIGVEEFIPRDFLEPIPEELLDSFLNEMAAQLTDLLVEAKEKQVQQMAQRLFLKFQDRTIVTREKVIESCHRMLEGLTPALQNSFAIALTNPLLAAYKDERDSKIVREETSLLHRMAINLVQFLQYQLASRILLTLQHRQRQLEETKDPYAQRLAKILDRKLDPTLQKILIADLSSEDPSRHRQAVLLIGSLGRVAIPLLLEVVKRADEMRTRTVAAQLLAKMGDEAAQGLKRELVLGGAAEERSRILDVIEVVTRDLRIELAYALGEENPKVRQAAFRLLERLGDSQSVDVLLEYARGDDDRLAMEAMECLGKLKPSSAVKVLVSILEGSKKTDRLVACCRALGQMADPAAIEPLVRILTDQGFFSRLKKGWSEVRAMAAYALGQISNPRATEVLMSLENDPDPRVQEVAKKCLKTPLHRKSPSRMRSEPLRREGSRRHKPTE